MPRLSSSAYISKILRRHDFVFISQRGSHMKFRKRGRTSLMVIVPANRKEIPIGTFRSILRQSRLSTHDFE